jgi:predicted Ser/Thr protein kinase
MSNETPRPGKKRQQRAEDHTHKLEKAIEDISKGKSIDGTLVEIEAHSGEHPRPPKKPGEPSVSQSLKNAKRRKPGTPDIEPAATMYEPTRPGQVSAGSNMATQHGPTGAGSPSQTPSASGGQGPVAPFGGKIMVGTRVGQIEVTGVLGKGGMGEVFKGYHHALDINVAVKVLPDELSRNELVRQRFLREARLCVKLDHPHIVRVFNVDEYAGNLFLVMEMVEGTDSANMLKNGGRFRYKRALEIGAACADALAYAQTQGLVHRDVKPHNILLGREDGKIKLSDFGLATAPP